MHFFSSCSTIPQLSNSDHLGLLLMNHCNVPTVFHPRRTVWRYKFADFDRANETWKLTKYLIQPDTIQWSWEKLKAAFLDVMEQCIPKALLPQRRSIPWLTKRNNATYQKRLARAEVMMTSSSCKIRL